MKSTNPQRWARVSGVSGMHLLGLSPGTWYRVVPAPDTAAAMVNDIEAIRPAFHLEAYPARPPLGR